MERIGKHKAQRDSRHKETVEKNREYALLPPLSPQSNLINEDVDRPPVSFLSDEERPSSEGVPARDSFELQEIGADKKIFHVGRPNIGDRDRLMKRIGDLLDRRWLSNFGPYVCEFEEAIEQLTGAKHCIAVCNGTIALELAIRALDLCGEVIVPSFTFVATAHALSWHGVTPVFCDIDPITYTMDPRRVEELITPQTTAILGVHVWGSPCEVHSLQEIATRRNLKLIFDAAHAFGCSLNGNMIGSFGDAEIFSFHATKYLNSFEGGAVVTNSDALAERIHRMQNFGFGEDGNVHHLGTNGKMTEVAAAMGLTSLESRLEFLEVNRNNYRAYEAELSDIPGIKLVNYNERDLSNYHYVVLEVDRNVCRIGRDDLWRILQSQGILARRYFYPGCHRMEPYATQFPTVGNRLPNTEALAGRVLVLPTGTAVSREDIGGICGIIQNALSTTSRNSPKVVPAGPTKAI